MSRLLRPRVLLADDHRMVAEGLKTLLSKDFELVGLVEDGLALVEAAGLARDGDKAGQIGQGGR